MLGRFWRTAEDRIREAMQNGEFDALPGKGKPLELESYDPFIPREQQLILKMVRNSSQKLPENVELAREMTRVRRSLADSGLSADDRLRIERYLEELEARATELLKG